MSRSLFLLLTLLFSLTLCACTHHKKDDGSASADTTITVKDDTAGLLLTWIDEKGDFHVEQKVTDVPLVGRDAVRVVDPNKDEGTHADKIFVADLRLKGADGTYPVKSMTRADFDKLAVDRRAKHGMPTLASAAPSASGSAAPVNTATDPTQGGNRPPVIIYGAEWCGACHEAAAYLRHKGIPYVEKDIEKDPGASAEMNAKLRRTGLRSGSIPVIDVRGKVMVGFNSQEIDDALGKAL